MPDLSDVWRELRELKAEVRRLKSSTLLENASIDRGALWVKSAEGLIVSGSAKVTGQFVGDGTFSWTGPVNIGGTCTISGPLNVTGNVTTSGSFTNSGTFTNNGKTNLNGATDVKGDLNVISPGKVKAGNLTIDPSTGSGSILFSNGAQVFTDGSTIQVYKGNGVVQISDTAAVLQLGGVAINVSVSGVRMTGLPTITRANANNATVGTVYSDASGNFYRVVT